MHAALASYILAYWGNCFTVREHRETLLVTAQVWLYHLKANTMLTAAMLTNVAKHSPAGKSQIYYNC